MGFWVNDVFDLLDPHTILGWWFRRGAGQVGWLRMVKWQGQLGPIYIYTYTHIYINTYTYIYIYIYIHIYIHTYPTWYSINQPMYPVHSPGWPQHLLLPAFRGPSATPAPWMVCWTHRWLAAWARWRQRFSSWRCSNCRRCFFFWDLPSGKLT